jgi:hypothetical protein
LVIDDIHSTKNNPVLAGLVKGTKDFSRPSARHRIFGDASQVTKDVDFLKNEVKDTRAYLTGRGAEPVLRRRWQTLKSDRQAGDESFVHGLEEIVGKRLVALPRGRPRMINSRDDSRP